MLFRVFLRFYSATACTVLQILFRSERVKVLEYPSCGNMFNLHKMRKAANTGGQH